jgi:hypothetical protein
MTKIRIYSILILLLLFMAQSISSHVLRNNGAYIFTTKKSFIRVNKLDVKNELNGNIYINIGSEFNVKGNIYNTLGNFILRDSSVSVIDSNVVNGGSLRLNDTSRIWVKKNIFNAGLINNQNLIEIGE